MVISIRGYSKVGVTPTILFGNEIGSSLLLRNGIKPCKLEIQFGQLVKT